MAFLGIFFSIVLGGWIFPWWWPAVAAYAFGFWLPKKPSSALAAGFFGSALAWFFWAFLADIRNHHILSARMAKVFNLPTLNHLPPLPLKFQALLLSHLPSYFIILLTALIGGLMGVIAARAGFSLRTYLRPKFSKPV